MISGCHGESRKVQAWRYWFRAVHYSGHGGRVKDETGEDPSGYCSTLCPVDFDKPRVGQILDKELYKHLVCSMQKGTSLTCLMDCCHSGEYFFCIM